MSRFRFCVVTLVCVLFGAACTVGTAWYFAYVTDTPRNGGFLRMASFGLGDELDEAFQAEHPNFLFFGTVVKLAGPTRGFWARLYKSVVTEPGDMDPGLADIAINLPCMLWIRSGWPWPALECVERWPPRSPEAKVIEGGFYVLRPRRAFEFQDAQRPLPCTPIWSGFAANWAVFTAVTLIPFLVFASIKGIKAWRRRPGVCVACGYPRGASPQCTECGAGHASAVG